MGKRIWLLLVIIILTLSTGCEFNIVGTSQETPSGPSLDEISTLSALSTQAYATPTLELPDLPTFTSNVDLNELGEGGEEPTKTPMAGSIKITAITQRSPGVAQVTWEASGDFPSGFKIVITDQQSKPTFPENIYTSVYSSTARAGVINYDPDRIYYVRVCRYMIDSCDIYSDLGIFAFAPPTATPKPTKTSAAVIVNGTSITYDPTLVITLMKGGSNGKAYMEWTDKSTSAKGYKIVYSTTSQTPTFGVDSYFYISDPTARSAYVDGSSGAKYYYRICRYTGTACSSYSAVYTFTFPIYTITSTPTISSTVDSSTITISTITDTATGVAQVDWTATGTFTNGFKILYSITTALPTLSDSVTVVSDGSLRLGNINGDPSGTYHVRVCKYTGSSCSVYSPVVDFTFAADPAVITITGLNENSTAGSINLVWTATGTFTNGFKVLYSTSQATPTYENASILTVASGGTRTATVVGTENTHYYLRVCKFTGTGCGVYSNIVEFTTATSGITLTKDGAIADKYDWVVSGDNADGYIIFWASGTIMPVWTSGLSTQQATIVPTDRTITLTTPLTTGHYILRLCIYSAASGGSCTAYSNTVEVDIS
ncbi:MAG: hypothetical protein C0410_09845 [Anaerolinea sp.]|nr:hypothetical protein [Anaerolinea sp.]